MSVFTKPGNNGDTGAMGPNVVAGTDSITPPRATAAMRMIEPRWLVACPREGTWLGLLMSSDMKLSGVMGSPSQLTCLKINRGEAG